MFGPYSLEVSVFAWLALFVGFGIGYAWNEKQLKRARKAHSRLLLENDILTERLAERIVDASPSMHRELAS